MAPVSAIVVLPCSHPALAPCLLLGMEQCCAPAVPSDAQPAPDRFLCPLLAAAVLQWWCCPWLPWQSWGQSWAPACAAVSAGSPETSSAASVLRYLAFPGIAFVISAGKGEVLGPWEQQLPEEALAKQRVQGLSAHSCSSPGSRVTDPFPAA